MIPFDCHNVLLPDGRMTRPGEDLVSDRPHCRAAVQLFRGFGCRSVVDLGCLEGGFAAEFSRHFEHVAAVEVRAGNFARCEFLREAGFSVEFHRDDVWNLDEYGPFDGVYCGGLLYHLDRPRAFLQLLANQTGRVCVIDTHFSTDRRHPKFRLSDITQHEGVRGRWYREFDDRSFPNREQFRWSSWDNRRSFWIHRRELPQAIRDAGFGLVLEHAEMRDEGHQRGLFVAVK